MGDVLVAFVKDHTLPIGDSYAAGQVVPVGFALAEQFVSRGVAVYYSDFTDSLLVRSEAPAVEAPIGEGPLEEAPAVEAKKGKGK